MLLFPSAFDVLHFAPLLSFSHSGAVAGFPVEQKRAAHGHSPEHFGAAVSQNNWGCPENNNLCSVPVIPVKRWVFKAGFLALSIQSGEFK